MNAQQTKSSSLPKQSRQSRRAKSRADKSGKRALVSDSSANKRWNLKLDSFNAGPVSMKGLSAGSGARTVGVAPRSLDVQVVMPRITNEPNRAFGSCDVLCGTEYLKSVSTDALGALKGDILATLLINPNAFPTTRLAQFAPLYQRYRFRKLAFIYEPIANATQSGQLIGYGDYDIDNQLTLDSPQNVSIAAAHFGQGISQIWEPREFPFGVLDDFTTLFTAVDGGNENRLIYQGVYYLIAASDLGNSLPLGNIYIAYEIEFYIPQLSITSVFTREWALTLTGDAATSTYANPMGNAVTPITTPPVNSNITYAYAGGVFTFTGLPLGYYLLGWGVPGTSAVPGANMYGGNTSAVVYNTAITLTGGLIVSDTWTSGNGYTVYGPLMGSAVCSPWAVVKLQAVTSSATMSVSFAAVGIPSSPMTLNFSPVLLLYSIGALPPPALTRLERLAIRDAARSARAKNIPHDIEESISTKNRTLSEERAPLKEQTSSCSVAPEACKTCPFASPCCKH